MSAGRRHIMLGTAGHVDHGKTALVKLLTGCETDTLAEEKERGLTIDLGFAPCRLADERIVGIVDVPGHVDFIRNMAAGAHGVDVVILVVAADDGIMPQTHEHLHILTLMGLRHGLVALTKTDLVEPARLAEVTADLRRLLSGTFLRDAPICPVSNLTGAGYERFFEALNEQVNLCEDRPDSGLFRLWVEDVFPIKGAGTVVTGIPTRGRVKVGEVLTLLPPGVQARVRQMQVYGAESAEARAGECVALNLPEIDHAKAGRGMLLTVGSPASSCSTVEAEFRVLESLRGPLPDLMEVHVHIGTAAVTGRLALLDAAESLPGQTHMVQLRLGEPLPLLPGERFVLRANSPGQGPAGLVTIGGGRILGTSDRKLRRNKRWTLDWLAERRKAIEQPALWCEQIMLESRAPLSIRELAARCAVAPGELVALLETLRARGHAWELPSKEWVHGRVVQRNLERIVAALDTFHAANPQRLGMSPEDLRRTAEVPAELFEAVLSRAESSGDVRRSGTVLARSNWKPVVASTEDVLKGRVLEAYAQAGFAGPTPGELAARFGIAPDRVERALRSLVEQGAVIKLDEKTWIHRGALELARQKALELFRKQPRFSTMEFRDVLGVSRKYAVPLLDYLDRTRFTVRFGHDRTPGAEARKILQPGDGNAGQ